MSRIFSLPTSLSIVKGKPHLAAILTWGHSTFQPNFGHITISIFSVWHFSPPKTHLKQRENWHRGRRLHSHSYDMPLFGNPKIVKRAPLGLVHLTMNEKKQNKTSKHTFAYRILLVPWILLPRCVIFIHFISAPCGKVFFCLFAF